MECALCLNLLSEPADPNSPTFVKRPKKTPDLSAEELEDKKLCALTCGHVFHEKCVISLYEFKNGFPECPVCRKSYALREMRVIYLPESSTTVDQMDKLIKENRELKRQLARLKNEDDPESEQDKANDEEAVVMKDNSSVKEPEDGSSSSEDDCWLNKSDFY